MVRVKTNTSKVAASSLLEVMVALVVIFTVFGLATGLYTNVLQSSFTLQQSKAHIVVEKLAAETKNKQSFIDENLTVEALTIEKTIKPYTQQEGVVVLELIAKNVDARILAEHRELVFIEK